jgi:hypothetical protein
MAGFSGKLYGEVNPMSPVMQVGISKRPGKVCYCADFRLLCGERRKGEGRGGKGGTYLPQLWLIYNELKIEK